MKGQVELPVFAIAALLLTATVVFGVSAAHSAFSNEDRAALEAQTAESLSDQLVATENPQTERENVLSSERLADIESHLDDGKFDLPADAGIRIHLDGELIAARGEVTEAEASTVERLVVVENRTVEQTEPNLDDGHWPTIPRRSYNTSIRLDPDPGVTVHAVRANDEVILANAEGLTGTFEVAVSPQETTQLQFDTVGLLETGDVVLRYEASETTKATLAVTVDE